MAAISAEFNSYDLQDAYTITSELDQYSTADKEIELLENPKSDGGILVNTRFGSKIIPIHFVIAKSTWAEVDEELDTMNAALHGVTEATLTIDWGSTTREYTAVAGQVKVEPREQTVGVADCSLDFTVPSGVGVDPASDGQTDSAIATADFTNTIAVGGSHKPYPTYRLTMTTAGNVTSFRFTNLTNNKQFQITPTSGFNDGDIVDIDTDPATMSVKFNSNETDFDGVLPDLDLGTNSYYLEFIGDTVFQDQQQAEEGTTSWWSIYATNYNEQSFIPTQTEPCPKVVLRLKRIGYPYKLDENLTAGGDTNDGFQEDEWKAQSFTMGESVNFYGFSAYVKKTAGVVNNLYAILRADDGTGKPTSGNSTNLWTANVSYHSIGTSYSWIKFFNGSTPVALTSGTKYHILLRTTSTTSDAYFWYLDTDGGYASGNKCYSANAGVTWSSSGTTGHDFLFKIWVENALKVRIETDAAGDPSGSLVHASYETELDVDDFPTAGAIYDQIVPFTTTTDLTALSTYHIVVEPNEQVAGNGDTSNCYQWAEADGGSYAGQAKSTVDDGTTWTTTNLNDMIFTTYYTAGAAGHTADFAILFNKLYV